jgi:hypothetical protein
MFRRLSLTTLAVLLVAVPLTTTMGADSAPPPPAPFGKYLVYSAAGVYDPTVPPIEGDLAEWFHREVMGRDDAAIEAERAAADAYFTATFGDLYMPGSLEAFGLDPRVGYTAYFVSGEKVGPDGWAVRDGGFRADLLDGTFVVYGDYSIKATGPGRGRGRGHGRRDPEPIIIHYESVDPIHNHPDGSGYFRCRLRSNSFHDFGGGLAQGMFADQTLPDGRIVSNIRNILTFPGLGFGAMLSLSDPNARE